jgi:hypothetical protein
MDHHVKIPAPIAAEESKKARRVSDALPRSELSALNFTGGGRCGYPLPLGYQKLPEVFV